MAAAPKKKHINYLQKIKPKSEEIQRGLTYTIGHFKKRTRLDYMQFVENYCLEHLWGGLLSWWKNLKSSSTS